VRSAWEDPPPKPAETPKDQDQQSPTPTPLDGPDEASQAAFDPVTGEINWDCPCLGGMAHGPCGPEFREAFSCFIHSEDEPKGINCVEKFKGMQDCFRAHPDVYGEGAFFFFFGRLLLPTVFEYCRLNFVLATLFTMN
jgi:mitochondrial intermembrane space import and assembly protein 40